MAEASLTMISLGPSISGEVGSLVWGTSHTNTNDITILLVKVPIMQVLFFLPT